MVFAGPSLQTFLASSRQSSCVTVPLLLGLGSLHQGASPLIYRLLMSSRRYTIVVADPRTGATRQFTFRVRPIAAAVLAVLCLPVLLGFALRIGPATEVQHLRASNVSLEQENSSYREATGALAAQIESLQAAINDLGVRAKLDPASARAIDKL